MTVRVVLVDDAVLIREGIARILEDRGVEVVAQLDDAERLTQVVADVAPDVVITDIRMPPTNTDEGLRAAVEVKQTHPEVGVLVLSQYLQTRSALGLLQTTVGGVGYLLKERVTDAGEFVQSVLRIAAGESVVDPEVTAALLRLRRDPGPLELLTDRETEVLDAMAQGRSNHSIADALSMNVKTVETHVRSVFAKLGLHESPDENRRVRAVIAYIQELQG